MEDKKLNKIENLIVYGVSSLGTIGVYCTGVNLSKESNHHTPIFLTTIALSFVSPYLFSSLTTKVIFKFKDKFGKDKEDNPKMK